MWLRKSELRTRYGKSPTYRPVRKPIRPCFMSSLGKPVLRPSHLYLLWSATYKAGGPQTERNGSVPHHRCKDLAAVNSTAAVNPRVREFRYQTPGLDRYPYGSYRTPVALSRNGDFSRARGV